MNKNWKERISRWLDMPESVTYQWILDKTIYVKSMLIDACKKRSKRLKIKSLIMLEWLKLCFYPEASDDHEIAKLKINYLIKQWK